MSDVIFARPRWDYQSYADYWRLIQLAGYPLTFIDEIDANSDNTYIFSQPPTDWHHGWQNPRARVIYYAIEWYLDVDYRAIPGVELWSADKWYAERIGAKYVPMGSHRDLNPQPDERCEKVYDVATLWAGSYPRYHAEDLIARYMLTRAPNAWGEERHRVLSQSRMMVAVHQNHDVQTVAPQRWALAAAYRLPVVSETLADAGIVGDVTITCDLESIGEVAASWKRQENASKLRAKGDALYELLCERWTFRKGIEAAL